MPIICNTCGTEHPERHLGNMMFCIKMLYSKVEALQLQLMNAGVCPISEPIHEWFSLSYAQYLTIPRSILQSMPTDWQVRFVGILQELDDTYDWYPVEGRYWVRLRDSKGRFAHDPFTDYERGRRRLTSGEVEKIQQQRRLELQRLPLKAVG